MDALIRMTGSAFLQLEGLFRRAEPREVGAFLLCGRHTSDDTEHYYVREVLAPHEGSWRTQGDAVLAPTTSWMSEAIGRADAAGLGLAFIHSHPPGVGGPAFSPVDEWMHETLVPVMLDNLGDRGFASLVYHDSVVSGAAWTSAGRIPVQHIAVVADHLRFVDTVGAVAVDDARYDRHLHLWSAEGQAALGRLRVVIVGAGGTGSATAVELVRSGVRNLVIVDPDALELTNVTRVYGSTMADVGRNKAEVLARHVGSIWDDRDVVALPRGVECRSAVEALVAADVIFGCTDNAASRSVINDVAFQYLIPVIDVGCRIGVVEGRTRGIACEVRLVHPDGPCYLCGGIVDPGTVREDLLPADEREHLRDEGYVRGLREEPSVVPVTTVTASLGVLRLFDLVLDLVGYPDAKLILDLQTLERLYVPGKVDPGCICRERLAIGDQRPAWWLDDTDDDNDINNRVGKDRPAEL